MTPPSPLTLCPTHAAVVPPQHQSGRLTSMRDDNPELQHALLLRKRLRDADTALASVRAATSLAVLSASLWQVRWGSRATAELLAEHEATAAAAAAATATAQEDRYGGQGVRTTPRIWTESPRLRHLHHRLPSARSMGGASTATSEASVRSAVSSYSVTSLEHLSGAGGGSDNSGSVALLHSDAAQRIDGLGGYLGSYQTLVAQTGLPPHHVAHEPGTYASHATRAREQHRHRRSHKDGQGSPRQREQEHQRTMEAHVEEAARAHEAEADVLTGWAAALGAVYTFTEFVCHLVPTLEPMQCPQTQRGQAPMTWYTQARPVVSSWVMEWVDAQLTSTAKGSAPAQSPLPRLDSAASLVASGIHDDVPELCQPWVALLRSWCERALESTTNAEHSDAPALRRGALAWLVRRWVAGVLPRDRLPLCLALCGTLACAPATLDDALANRATAATQPALWRTVLAAGGAPCVSQSLMAVQALLGVPSAMLTAGLAHAPACSFQHPLCLVQQSAEAGVGSDFRSGGSTSSSPRRRNDTIVSPGGLFQQLQGAHTRTLPAAAASSSVSCAVLVLQGGARSVSHAVKSVCLAQVWYRAGPHQSLMADRCSDTQLCHPSLLAAWRKRATAHSIATPGAHQHPGLGWQHCHWRVRAIQLDDPHRRGAASCRPGRLGAGVLCWRGGGKARCPAATSAELHLLVDHHCRHVQRSPGRTLFKRLEGRTNSRHHGALGNIGYTQAPTSTQG